MRTVVVSLIGVGHMGHAIGRRLLEYESSSAQRRVRRPVPMSVERPVADADHATPMPPLVWDVDEPAPHDIALRVWDLDADRVRTLVEAGADPCTSLQDAASSPIVVTVVPDDGALRDVALASDGVLATLPPGGVHLGLSTVSADVTRDLAHRYKQAGKSYVAATMVGRPEMARHGRLGLFVAGDPAAKRQVAHILRRLSAAVQDLGPHHELAATAKLVANHHIGLTILMLAETAALARASGIDPGQVFRLLRDCGAFGGASWETYSDAVATKTHQPAQFPVGLGHKDLSLIHDHARRVGLQLPLARLFTSLLEGAIEQGDGAKDWSVAAQVFAGNCLEGVDQPV